MNGRRNGKGYEVVLSAMVLIAIEIAAGATLSWAVFFQGSTLRPSTVGPTLKIAGAFGFEVPATGFVQHGSTSRTTEVPFNEVSACKRLNPTDIY